MYRKRVIPSPRATLTGRPLTRTTETTIVSRSKSCQCLVFSRADDPGPRPYAGRFTVSCKDLHSTCYRPYQWASALRSSPSCNPLLPGLAGGWPWNCSMQEARTRFGPLRRTRCRHDVQERLRGDGTVSANRVFVE